MSEVHEEEAVAVSPETNGVEADTKTDGDVSKDEAVEAPAGKTRQSTKEAKWEVTDREARSIIDAEADARRRKTEKLQASRLARDKKERRSAARKATAKKAPARRARAPKAAD